MKILVMNRGSSTLKCHLYDSSSISQNILNPIWNAHVEWTNESPDISLNIITNKEKKHSENFRPSGNAIEYIMQLLITGNTAVLHSLDEVDIIGHRIVHGGREYQSSILIDENVKEQIRKLFDLAPLHNPPGLEGIEISSKLFKNKPQIAVFDTAFHHTMPLASIVYPIPYKWFEEGIQRYGFHGISYQYCSKKAAELLNTDIKSFKMVACHLGSGASLCAIKEGKSIDTTMGFTPLEGLMMDTRSGTIDPGIILYLLEKKKIGVDELSKILYERSGLLGVSGIASDMRDILKNASQGNERDKLALDVYTHRLASMISSMACSLNGLDVLLFTGGIGENSPEIRKQTCQALSFLGIVLDDKKNEMTSSYDCDLSAQDSKCKIFLIHTREELEIARECLNYRLPHVNLEFL